MTKKPIGWITRESSQRLRYYGGNGSRGTVPLHAKPSSVACIPLYGIPKKRDPTYAKVVKFFAKRTPA
jgi:hypothetical protein